MQIKIVSCQPKDVKTLQKISRQTFAETFGAQNKPADLKEYLDQAYRLPKFLREINNPHSWFYFIQTDDEVAGYLKLNIDDAQSEPMDHDALEIERIYLAHNKQKLGLGGRLFHKALQEAQRHHKHTIWLGVWEHNENGKGFYHHLGFKPFSDHVFQVGEDKQRDILMQRKISY